MLTHYDGNHSAIYTYVKQKKKRKKERREKSRFFFLLSLSTSYHNLQQLGSMKSIAETWQDLANVV